MEKIKLKKYFLIVPEIYSSLLAIKMRGNLWVFVHS